MKSKDLTRKKILWVVLVVTLGFIWGHSMMPIPASAAESENVRGFLLPLLEFFFGRGNVTDNLVRKLAHITEFGALGAEFMAMLALSRRPNLRGAAKCLNLGLLAAVLDETIQLFSARGSSLKDVWIDFGGVLLGVGFVWLLWLIFHKRETEA